MKFAKEHKLESIIAFIVVTLMGALGFSGIIDFGVDTPPVDELPIIECVEQEAYDVLVGMRVEAELAYDAAVIAYDAEILTYSQEVAELAYYSSMVEYLAIKVPAYNAQVALYDLEVISYDLAVVNYDAAQLAYDTIVAQNAVIQAKIFALEMKGDGTFYTIADLLALPELPVAPEAPVAPEVLVAPVMPTGPVMPVALEDVIYPEICEVEEVEEIILTGEEELEVVPV